MRVHDVEGRTVYFEEDDGRLILRVEVTRIPMLTNGYAVALRVEQGEGEAQEESFTAASRPLPWPNPELATALVKAGWKRPAE